MIAGVPLWHVLSGPLPAEPVADGISHDQLLVAPLEPGQLFREHRHALPVRARHTGDIGAPEAALRAERVKDLPDILVDVAVRIGLARIARRAGEFYRDIGVFGHGQHLAQIGKGGIISLTRQMAREYARDGIRVNCIAPGTVETPMNIKVLERVPNPAELRRSWERMHPMGRIGQPLDIAWGALYLACDESSWVTGQCLSIDGGVSCTVLPE